MIAKRAEEAAKLRQEISSTIDDNRCWEHHPGNAERLKKLLNAVEEVKSLLYKLGLINGCHHLWELSGESEYRVDRVLKVIFEFIKADEEEK